jgi:hypothetical protein
VHVREERAHHRADPGVEAVVQLHHVHDSFESSPSMLRSIRNPCIFSVHSGTQSEEAARSSRLTTAGAAGRPERAAPARVVRAESYSYSCSRPATSAKSWADG